VVFNAKPLALAGEENIMFERRARLQQVVELFNQLKQGRIKTWQVASFLGLSVDLPTEAVAYELMVRFEGGVILASPLQKLLEKPVFLIDCDTTPFLVHPSWIVESHQKSGLMEWDPRKVTLYCSPDQESNKGVSGRDLLQELSGKPVLNANVLDSLLANPEYIPEEMWEGNFVFFWGTRYYHPNGYVVVRYLARSGGVWYPFWTKIDNLLLFNHHLAAMIKD